jgi:hypothetical protein
MDLDLAEAGFAESRQPIQVLATVLLGREEEGVPRWPSVSIRESSCQLWQALAPCIHTGALDRESGIAMRRFEVICHAEQNVYGAIVGHPHAVAAAGP